MRLVALLCGCCSEAAAFLASRLAQRGPYRISEVRCEQVCSTSHRSFAVAWSIVGFTLHIHALGGRGALLICGSQAVRATRDRWDGQRRSHLPLSRPPPGVPRPLRAHDRRRWLHRRRCAAAPLLRPRPPLSKLRRRRSRGRTRVRARAPRGCARLRAYAPTLLRASTTWRGLHADARRGRRSTQHR